MELTSTISLSKRTLRVDNFFMLVYLILFFLVFFGGVGGYGYTFAPYLATLSVLYILSNPKHISKVYLFKPLIIMMWLTIIFSYNYFFFNYVLTRSYIRYISFALLPYLTTFVFYLYARKGYLEYKFLLFVFLLAFFVGVYRFYHGLMLIDNYKRQNNYFYYVFMFIPMFLLLKNKYLKTILLIVTGFVCVFSLKRSSLLGFSLITLVYIYIDYFTKSKSKFKSYIFLAIVFIFILNYIDLSQFFQSYDRAMERMDMISDDGGSGRIRILNEFFENDIYDGGILLGEGSQAIYNKHKGEILALHNDLFETLYSLGLFGFIAYLIFIYRLGKEVVFAYKSSSSDFVALSSALIIVSLFTFTGGVFSFVDLCLPFFAFIGISQSKYSLEKKHE